MEWISVKDKLPEKEFFYIAYDPDDGEDQSHCVIPLFYDKVRGFIDIESGVIEFFPGVTHWMPLPQPPK